MDLPKPAFDSPYGVKLTPGVKAWCACGLSKKQPLCDSSHKGTEMKSVKFEITETDTYWPCACKHTKTPPFCDGTHNEVFKKD